MPFIHPSDPRSLADGLVEEEPGFYVASGAEAVSYPEQGHAALFGLEDASYWFRHRNACVTATLRRLPPRGPIIDIGGGNGYVSLALQAAGFDTILLEPGRDGARNAYSRGLRPVIEATFEAARFHPESLWAVGLFDVLEHIEDDALVLQALVAAMRRGGRLYLTVPAYRALWSFDDVDAGHFRRYNSRSLRRVMSTAGLELEYMTHLFWFLPVPIAVLRTLAGRIGLRRGGRAALRRSEYVAPGAIADGALRGLLTPEVSLVKRGSSIPFGSSILAVARLPR